MLGQRQWALVTLVALQAGFAAHEAEFRRSLFFRQGIRAAAATIIGRAGHQG
jgi:hypothetical protein